MCVGDDMEKLFASDMANLWKIIANVSLSEEARVRSLTAWLWVCVYVVCALYIDSLGEVIVYDCGFS